MFVIIFIPLIFSLSSLRFVFYFVQPSVSLQAAEDYIQLQFEYLSSATKLVLPKSEEGTGRRDMGVLVPITWKTS
jgi:hypothetical protein